MKTDKNDALKQFLSKNAPAPAQHPWFTANVLHRLPDRKPRYSWVLRLTYALAAVACLICWSRVIPELASPVITLRTVTEVAATAAVSVIVLSHYIGATLRS